MAFKEIDYRNPETIKNQIAAEKEADEIADARHDGVLGVNTYSESVRIQNPITGRTTTGREHEQFKGLMRMLGHSKVTKAIVDSYIGTTEWRRPDDNTFVNQGPTRTQINELRADLAEQEFGYKGEPTERPSSNVVELFAEGNNESSMAQPATAANVSVS